MDNSYDVVVIGAGTAGLSAALYTARAKLKTLVLEREVAGGQIINTEMVENYPGFPDGIAGYELSVNMRMQASKYGAEFVFAEATAIENSGDRKIVRTTEGDYEAKVVIITAGASPNKLGVPGEEEFTGRGVSYCATCDGAFFQNQVCVVVGGGDSALDEGLFLTRYASKVIVIHRRDQFRASKILQDRALSNPKMEFIWDTVVEEIFGDEEVRGIRLHNVKTGETNTLELSGVFVFIGHTPNTQFIQGLLELDAGGHIPVSPWMETEIPGIYAAGDVRQYAAKQLACAAGDGVTAAIAADKYISMKAHLATLQAS